MTIDGDDLVCALISAGLGCGLLLSYVAGQWLRLRLPHHHRSRETTEVLHAAIAMLVTFSAIVLGLMVTSAKDNFDRIGGLIEASAARIVQLDHALREYGPAADDARMLLERYTRLAAADIASPDADATLDANLLGRVERTLLTLPPGGPLEARLRIEALDRFDDLVRLRWQLLTESHPDSNTPFDIVLAIWLLVPFFVFGLNCDRNSFIDLALCLSAFAIVSAMFVVFDMATPLGGLVSVSGRGLHEAAARIAEPLPSPPPTGLALPMLR